MIISITKILVLLLLVASAVLTYNGMWAQASFNVCMAIYLELVTFIEQVKDSAE